MVTLEDQCCPVKDLALCGIKCDGVSCITELCRGKEGGVCQSGYDVWFGGFVSS